MAHFPEKQSISFFGLVAMGIGCMLGTSWLLLTGTWLETAGGPLNLIVAFALCIIIELPFAFAYMEAIPCCPWRRRGGLTPPPLSGAGAASWSVGPAF